MPAHRAPVPPRGASASDDSPVSSQRPSRLQAVLAGSPGWVGGALTGVQGAALGLIVVITPAFAAAAAAPTANGSAAIDWMNVTKLSVRLWLLAHGVPYILNGIAFTLAPLGLTLLIAFMIAAIAGRFCTKSWASWGVATGTYVGLVCAAEIGAMHGYPNFVANTVRAALFSFVIAGPAVAAGIWRAHGAEFGWVPRVSLAIRHGLRLGLATVAASLSVAAIVGGGFTYLGRGRIADAVATLGIDPLGGVALAFAQALYAPNISVWMLGWMTGQGFSVGEGNVYSPSDIAADAVPAFPIFGALPTISGGWIALAPFAIVALAAVARLALSRRIAPTVSDLPVIGVAVAVCAGVIAAVGSVATGALGPGRLAFVGVEVIPVAVTFALLAALGFSVTHGLLMLWRLLMGRRTERRVANAPFLSVVPDSVAPDPPPEREASAETHGFVVLP